MPECNIRNFGFQSSRNEAFCTGLLAQSLSLSNKFASLFLSKIGFGSSYCITSVECENSIPNSGRRPDMWIDVSKKNDVNGLPVQVLLESKITSPETNNQLTDYRKYVDAINRGEVSTHEEAKLILLSTFKDMAASCEPDLRISWDEILEIISVGGRVGKSNFEDKYFSMVHEHLSSVCGIAPPEGSTRDFIQMMEQLAINRPWLECRHTDKQVALYVNETDSWIQSRKTEKPRQPTLIIIDKIPAKFNGMSKVWFPEWLPDNKDHKRFDGEARRNGLNHARLHESLEEILKLIDEARER